MLFINQK